ncbi:uncharacterized protein LOC126740729 [Anthonomus grandis grandis]|uniref:uncharacterized protein LOC126740729 n=1 Tax=Anthonomus grandis grandis TaxID=2921223 RepID=UPI002165943E|nr:uncharacterized protein LOC126740729 [Anthonomus grandis grandis]
MIPIGFTSKSPKWLISTTLMLFPQNSEEDIKNAEDDDRPRIRIDPRYKIVPRELEKYRNRTFLFIVTRPTAPEPPKIEPPPEPTHVKTFLPKQDALVYHCQPNPRGVVNVFKSCALNVRQSALKVDNVEISKASNLGSNLDCTQTFQIDINKENCRSKLKADNDADKLLAPLLREIQNYNVPFSKVSVTKRKNKCQNTCTNSEVIPKELDLVLGLYKNNSQAPQDSKDSLTDLIRFVNGADTTECLREDCDSLKDFVSAKRCLREDPYSSNHTLYNCKVSKKNVSVLGGKQSSRVHEINEPKKSVNIFYCKKCKKYKNIDELRRTDSIKVIGSSKQRENTQISLPNLKYLDRARSSTYKAPSRQIFPSKSSFRSVDSSKGISRSQIYMHNPSLHQFCKSVISSINKLSEKLPSR